MKFASLFSALALVVVPVTAQASLRFVDVTASVGIKWVQHQGMTMMGAGGAFLDYDRDGWQDILLAGGTSQPTLYRNVNGGARFQVVTKALFAPPGVNESDMCVTVADIDNDGDPDIYFGRKGFNLLYRNDGGGVFTDITTPLMAGAADRFTTTAAFGDFDSDGALDLYVGNYITPSSTFPYHTAEPNRMFRGHGDGGFTEITTPALANTGTALALSWTDIDSDGDVDLMVANDFGRTAQPNRLFRNDGPSASGWKFTEVSAAYGTDLSIFCMGIAIGDVDRDGDFDYYYTNIGRNVMLRNDGNAFTDITTGTGTELIYDPSTQPRLLASSWGTGFHDFDSDGWLDLYVSNGHIPAVSQLANGKHTRNTLFRHNGPSLTFSEVKSPLDNGVGRGAAFADYDNDGDVDILQMNINGAPVLMRNDTPKAGHWLEAKLHGRQSNCDALGARIDVQLGAFVASREVSCNYSYQSSSEARQHFGLGNSSRIEQLQVKWPSGVKQQLHDVAMNRAMDLVEPVVTVSHGRTRVLSLPRGKLVFFVARIDNETDVMQRAYYQPQIRVGDGSRLAGQTLWQGTPRARRVPPHSRRFIMKTLFVPKAALPLPAKLDFVWLTADAGLGFDEDKISISLK